MQKEILERYKKNPILVPNDLVWWESQAVFNCGVLFGGDNINMLYRAVGEYEKYISRIGYASSIDGYNFNRSKEMALAPDEEYETYVSYVVLSNYVSQGPIASTAVATTTDFISYKRLGIITSKGSDNKDVVLFPQNMSRQTSNRTDSNVITYLFLHRPSTWIGSKYGVDRPSIWLGEGNSLTKFEKHTLLIKPEQQWEMLKVGAGPPPIKTRRGWLLIYHGVDGDHVYRTGAALLDLSDPSKVLGRTRHPILEPKQPYEKNGDVNNVVFPTGTCVMDAKL